MLLKFSHQFCSKAILDNLTLYCCEVCSNHLIWRCLGSWQELRKVKC